MTDNRDPLTTTVIRLMAAMNDDEAEPVEFSELQRARADAEDRRGDRAREELRRWQDDHRRPNADDLFLAKLKGVEIDTGDPHWLAKLENTYFDDEGKAA